MYMNKQESDILNVILQYQYLNQRALAEQCGFSLGIVNRSVKSLQGQGLLTIEMELTPEAKIEMAKHHPKNAVILAAGYGMRMVPINMETPKGLLEINGEPLIERLIRQLHEVNVKEIYVVVGFMKEQYDYLVDQYGVKLIVNMDYAEKNNLHSLAKALPYLGETYIVPCDLWCRENLFSEYEWYSWYLVSDAKDPDSTVRINRKWELVPADEERTGNHMIGISYLTDAAAQTMAQRIEKMVPDRRYDHVFWEDALFVEQGMPVQAKTVPEGAVVEINTYEQLTGNGNGMQYFGAILIQSELSLKELDDYYSDHRSNEWEYLVEIQEGQSIDVIDHETLNFGKEINDAGYYIVYSGESENSLLKELDIRGH